MRFWNFLLILFCSVVNGNIIECNDDYCEISCGYTNCESGIIYGHNATNLNVYCYEENSCNNVTIYCPINTNSICNITCLSCSNSVIYYDGLGLFDLDCDFYACNNLEINIGNQSDVDITCLHAFSCNDVIINANNVNSIDMNCSSDAGLEFAYASCQDIDINIQNVSDYGILTCLGEWSCSHLNINAMYANSFIANIDGGYTLYNSSINTEYAGNFELNCNSLSWGFACYKVTLIAPEHSIPKIDCKGYVY